ncbi:MAG: hypothetical protein IJM03_08035, partial [Treponema sp.]|nr:hypothetical protein [Treponema sp.]
WSSKKATPSTRQKPLGDKNCVPAIFIPQVFLRKLARFVCQVFDAPSLALLFLLALMFLKRS